MKGYKVFDPDWKCRDFQYEIGKTYEMDKDPILCEIGFHFCKKLVDCFNYYSFDPNNKVAEIEALGDIDEVEKDSKCCTNKIKIIREMSWNEVLDLVNIGHFNSGYYNAGYHNSGNHNSEDYNAGNYNSGDFNLGDFNSGYSNLGDYNSGYRNLGNCNTGNYNSGFRNSGNCNVGSYNSGDFNSGDYNSGCFNTTNANNKIMMFNKPSNWTFSIWEKSKAYSILNAIPKNSSKWIYENDMTEDEKQIYPEYKTTGGYLKEIEVSKEDKQKWWDKLHYKYKKEVMSLPNFDPDIFYKCTGIRVNNKENK